MSTGIPKNLRDALARQAGAGAHPGADALNAYAERGLTPAEDSQVAGHLAACADCRQVLFLAQSSIDSPAQTHGQEARPRMVTWWRWAMPITAAATIAVAVVTMNKTDIGPAHRQVARMTPAAGTIANEDLASAKPEKTKVKLAAEPALVKTPRETRAAEKMFAKKSPLPTRATAAAQVPPAMAMASAAPAPAVNEMARNIGTQQRNVQSANAAVQYGPAQRLAPNQNANHADESSAVEINAAQNKAATTEAAASPFVFKGRGVGAMASSDSDVTTKRSALSRVASQLWRISSDGHLERMMQNQWHRALNEVQKSFRVVAYVQDHVWAGGSGPELFHSSDGGENWSTIKVKTAEGELNGTMQTIRASDAQHLAIVTDDGSTWTTADGGQTWARQQ